MLIEAEICGKTLPRTLHPKTTKSWRWRQGSSWLERSEAGSRPLVLISPDPWLPSACIRDPQIGIVSKLSDGRPRCG